MKLTRRRSCRAESLEVRALLSSLAGEFLTPVVLSADFASDGPSGMIEVSLDGEDASHVIRPDELPPQVVDAVAAQFPGARLDAAAIDREGLLPQFDVKVNWLGANLELTLTATGQLIVTTQSLNATDLPEAVRNWLTIEFPGAAIRSAERVMSESTERYSIEFVTAADESLEATFHSPGNADEPAAEAGSQNPGGDSGRLSSSFVIDALATSQDSTKRSMASRDAGECAPSTVECDPGSTKSVPLSGRKDERGVSLALAVTEIAELATPRGAATIVGDVVAQTLPAAGPLVTLALTEVLPFDMELIEQALKDFLTDIDSLRPESQSSAAVARWAPLTLGVAVLYGIQRLVIERCRAKRNPLLAAGAGRSTWSWMLNLSKEHCSLEPLP